MSKQTFNYQDKREYSVNAAAPAGKVLIKEASHPTSVNVNQEFAWYVVGPAASIVLVRQDGSEVSLPKTYAETIYYKDTKSPCTDVDSRAIFRGAKFPAAGTYTIWLLSGYLSADEAAMGLPSLGGLYELATRHLKTFTGIPVTVQTAASRLIPTLAPLAVGGLLLLLK
ncbi:MAG: hypothetical protein ACPLZY_04235 [Candidatus Norongarragalinales archaeon]